METQTTAILKFLNAFYRFTRPHTMLGSSGALGTALASALLMNICIVGINQLYDIEIDKVNKPYLPLASGDFSVATGNAIIWVTGAISLAIGIASNSGPLLATLAGSLLLGIAYSTDLPFLRWKRYPMAAAACILAVRAVLVQLGFFFHMQQALGTPGLTLTRPVIFATGFMFVFSIVIALFKDIPDIAGDKQAGVNTLSVRFGQRRMFWTCIALLELAYFGAVGVSLCSELAWSRIAGAAAHILVGALVWWRALRTNLDSSKSIYDCYMDIWKAFYAEYLLLPLLR